MRTRSPLAMAIASAAAALGTLALAASAAADPGGFGSSGGHGPGALPRAVFVQTDDLAGNRVVVYDRAPDGELSPAGSYETTGLGGALEGSMVDHLASQGSLAYDRHDGLLLAVNAGSDTISAFAVSGDRLALRQVIGSGGSFPVSVAVQGSLVYVLNALQGGSVQGYSASGAGLVAIPGSNRPLGLNPEATPQFTTTPGQVAFSPDGSQLLVTTKGNGSDIDVFSVDRRGLLSSATVNSEPGQVPFSLTFDQFGDLLVADAESNALASFELHGDGTVEQVEEVLTGQAATCWVAGDGDYFFASNAGNASLSRFRARPHGRLQLLGTTATDGGTVDAAASNDGRFLYVQTGAEGIVDEFAVTPGGTLLKIGSVEVPGAKGGEGIVAF